MVGYSGLVAVHVVFALGGLAALPVPLLARKGGPLHRFVGWGFVVGMVGAGVTGLAMSALWLAVPEWVHPTPPGQDPATHAASLRSFGAFLGFLAWLILSSSWSGIRALRRTSPHLADRIFPAVLAGGGVALLVAGLAQWSWLFLSFGVLGLALGAADLTGLRRSDDRRALHARAMSGTAIAAVTAFLVLGVRRWVEVPELWGPLVWLGPVVIGVPLSRWLMVQDRRAVAV